MTGPLTIFEGKRGIYKLFGDGSPPEIERFWQGQFHILDTMFKLYPVVGTAHAALNALTEIQSRHAFSADKIEAINVGLVDWAIPHGAAIIRPTDVISAQFSLAFGVGPHRCIGSNIARVQLRITVEEWLARLPEFWITTGAQVRAVNSEALVLETLPISWNPIGVNDTHA